MPDLDLPGTAFAADPHVSTQAVEMICVSPITVKLLVAALAILVFLACHAVHAPAGPRR